MLIHAEGYRQYSGYVFSAAALVQYAMDFRMEYLDPLMRCLSILSAAVIPHMGMGLLMHSPRSPAHGAQALINNTRGWTHVEYSNGHLICT